jgi:DNA-binding NtrC family response regulator
VLHVKNPRVIGGVEDGCHVKSFRILHVDDDPLMRDVVELALGFDSEFVVMSCEDAEEALAAVPGWQPSTAARDPNSGKTSKPR